MISVHLRKSAFFVCVDAADPDWYNAPVSEGQREEKNKMAVALAEIETLEQQQLIRKGQSYRDFSIAVAGVSTVPGGIHRRGDRNDASASAVSSNHRQQLSLVAQSSGAQREVGADYVCPH